MSAAPFPLQISPNRCQAALWPQAKGHRSYRFWAGFPVREMSAAGNRREKDGDSGRDDRLGRNRGGVPGACPGSPKSRCRRTAFRSPVPRSGDRLREGAVSPEAKASAGDSGETAAGKEPDEAEGSNKGRRRPTIPAGRVSVATESARCRRLREGRDCRPVGKFPRSPSGVQYRHRRRATERPKKRTCAGLSGGRRRGLGLDGAKDVPRRPVGGHRPLSPTKG